jgi:hypothetical protein
VVSGATRGIGVSVLLWSQTAVSDANKTTITAQVYK